MQEEYKQLAEINEQIIHIRDKLTIENGKMGHFNGLSARDYSVVENMSSIKDFMENIMGTDISNVNNIEELFQQFNSSFSEYSQEIKTLTEKKEQLVEERREIVAEIKNTDDNPNLNVFRARQPMNKNKAFEALASLAASNPEKMRYYAVTVADEYLTSNTPFVVIEGSLEDIRDIIKNTEDNKGKYLKTIANDKIYDYFQPHKSVGIMYENGRIIKLNEFDLEDYKLAFPNKSTNKLKK